METSYWTLINHFFIWGSLLIFYIIHAVLYSNALGLTFVGTLRFLCSTPTYWLGVILGVTFLMVGVVALHLWRITFQGTLSDRLRVRASIQRSKSSSKSFIRRPRTSIKREFRTQSLRSGYAFAHEEGFGELITSGRYISKDPHVIGDTATNNQDNKLAFETGGIQVGDGGDPTTSIPI